MSDQSDKLKAAFLPGLPIDLIVAAYAAAPGNEIGSEKFFSEESSAALAANTFGFFMNRPGELPPFPTIDPASWPARKVTPECVLRFPWAGGRHPCLDAVIETDEMLIGVESKRYEPFRQKKLAELSEAYWRDVWGASMLGYGRVRDRVRDGDPMYERLDAGQLFKHAFALRSAVHRVPYLGKKAILLYLYAEPDRWHDGRAIPTRDIQRHRDEVRQFAADVDGDEVAFRSCTYRQLLSSWSLSDNEAVRSHAAAVGARFFI